MVIVREDEDGELHEISRKELVLGGGGKLNRNLGLAGRPRKGPLALSFILFLYSTFPDR